MRGMASGCVTRTQRLCCEDPEDLRRAKFMREDVSKGMNLNTPKSTRTSLTSNRGTLRRFGAVYRR